MAMSSAGAVLLMVVSALLWSAYLEYGTMVTGFTRLSLFFFGVVPMALLAFRFTEGDKARTESLYLLSILLLFVNQAVLAVQTGISYEASEYVLWKFIRSLALALGAAGLLLDAFLKGRRRLPGLLSAGCSAAVWLSWIIAVLSSAIEAAPYSPALLRFGLLESGQMLARILYLGGICFYLLLRDNR